MKNTVCISLILLVLFITCTGCSLVPGYKAVKVDYCERVRGVIYCDDMFVDTNYYDECSIYDRDCEPKELRR
jgi:hypothetical protein